jgi:hypothetical protein
MGCATGERKASKNENQQIFECCFHALCLRVLVANFVSTDDFNSHAARRAGDDPERGFFVHSV